MSAGPIICDATKAGYRGAKRATNNAAELTAVIELCTQLKNEVSPNDIVEIQTDSVIALLAALGVVPRKGKNRTKKTNETLRIIAREAYKQLQKHTNYRTYIKKKKPTRDTHGMR